MEYRNLRLQATGYQNEDGTERFRVHVSESPAGGNRLIDAEPVELPPDLRRRVRRLSKRQLSLAEMITMGEDLGAALFPLRARKLYDQSLATQKAREEGLRVQMEFDSYALADLPWEYLYFADPDTPSDQKDSKGFVALTRRVSLVRFQQLAQPLGSLEPLDNKSLRLVALLSNPPNTPRLDLETERKNIEQALSDVSGISPEFYPDATREILLQAFIRAVHVFHFSGHGTFEEQLSGSLDSQEGEAFVILTGADGAEDRFEAKKLAGTLSDKGVRLAMLGACESAAGDGVNAWTGVAPALIRAGLPAVVGMQFTVADKNAIAFSRSFYQALAAHQTIDEAVTEGRRAIDTVSNDSAERDWGVPVLYLHAEDGVLFPSPGPAPAEPFKGPPLKADPVITDALGTFLTRLESDQGYGYFMQRLTDTVEKVSALSDYKALHDGLHEICYSYFDNIIRSAKILVDDKYAKYDLIKYLDKYRREVIEMRVVTARKKVEAAEDKWVTQLEQAADAIEAGLAKNDKDQINVAIETINEIIGTQPTKINSKLFAAASIYNDSLPKIRDVMNQVREKFKQEAPASESARFEKGVDSLRELNTKLKRLIEQHNTWQEMDTQLGMLKDFFEFGPPAFVRRWRTLRVRIEPLYASDEAESSNLQRSSLRLKEADEMLERAITNAPNEVQEAFNIYCSRASDRFYDVDKSLLELCGQLKLIRDEILTRNQQD